MDSAQTKARFLDACRLGDLSLVDDSLSSIQSQSLHDTAFISAAANGHVAVIDRLLQVANVNATTHNNEAIRLAAENGHLAVVDRLLQVPAVYASAPNSLALRFAAWNGHLAVVNRLLQVPGVDATAEDNSAIRLAAWKGHIAMVDRLLQVPGVNATDNDNQAICLAAAHGHLAVVDRLLQVPAVDATADDNKPIRWASSKGYVAVVERLLREERVVLGLGLSPQVAHYATTRYAVAVAQCAGNELFRKEMVAAFGVAYECVRGELYGGMAEELCEWMWPVPLARQAVQVQRELAAALQRLQSAANRPRPRSISVVTIKLRTGSASLRI